MFFEQLSPCVGIIEDPITKLTGSKPRKAFPKDRCPAESLDPESGEVTQPLTNVTNILKIKILKIANFYHHY